MSTSYERYMRDQGYTLLELMISISIIGIIILIMGGAMRLGFRSVDSGEKRIESLERFKTSLNIVDSQIRSAIFVTLKGGEGNGYSFKGDSTSMQFPTSYSLWGNQMGYVTVTYRVVSNDYGKHTLYASESSIGIENKKETKLFDLFDSIYFEYFFKEPAEEKGKWIEEWTNKETIPEKIRLHLVNGANKLSMIIPVNVRDSLNKRQMVGGF